METYWIDKKGGRHYHKKDCLLVVGPPHYPYEAIEYEPPTNKFADIKVEGKYYAPCPGCMFEGRTR